MIDGLGLKRMCEMGKPCNCPKCGVASENLDRTGVCEWCGWNVNTEEFDGTPVSQLVHTGDGIEIITPTTSALEESPGAEEATEDEVAEETEPESTTDRPTHGGYTDEELAQLHGSPSEEARRLHEQPTPAELQAARKQDRGPK